jgi:hypothetical protein
MLDAGYSGMHQEYNPVTSSISPSHRLYEPEARNQDPRSANAGNSFRCTDIDQMHDFMQLEGYL